MLGSYLVTCAVSFLAYLMKAQYVGEQVGGRSKYFLHECDAMKTAYCMFQGNRSVFPSTVHACFWMSDQFEHQAIGRHEREYFFFEARVWASDENVMARKALLPVVQGCFGDGECDCAYLACANVSFGGVGPGKEGEIGRAH